MLENVTVDRFDRPQVMTFPPTPLISFSSFLLSELIIRKSEFTDKFSGERIIEMSVFSFLKVEISAFIPIDEKVFFKKNKRFLSHCILYTVYLLKIPESQIFVFPHDQYDNYPDI